MAIPLPTYDPAFHLLVTPQSHPLSDFSRSHTAAACPFTDPQVNSLSSLPPHLGSWSHEMSHPWGEPTICRLWPRGSCRSKPNPLMTSSLAGTPDLEQQPSPWCLCQASSHSRSSQASQPCLSPQPLLALSPAGPFLAGLPLKTRLSLCEASWERENICWNTKCH